MIAWLVLAAACGLIAFQVWQDRRIFPRFVALDESADRRQALRSWTLDSFFRFGVLGVLGLVLLGAADALWQMPDGLAAAISSTFSAIGLGPGKTLLLGWGLAGVLTIGLVAGAIAGARVDPETVPREGVGALLARNWKEALDRPSFHQCRACRGDLLPRPALHHGLPDDGQRGGRDACLHCPVRACSRLSGRRWGSDIRASRFLLHGDICRHGRALAGYPAARADRPARARSPAMVSWLAVV